MGNRREMFALCVALLAAAVQWSDSAPAPAPGLVTGLTAAAPAPAIVSVGSPTACTSLPNGGSANVTADGTLIVKNVTSANGARTFQVDPWIQPPCAKKGGVVSCNCNNTVTGQQNGNFLSYPVINATCRDSINFTMRAVQSGLRVHGVYLLQYSFVDPQSPKGYWCPDACTDVSVRNHSTPHSAGRCRAYNIVGFTQPDKSFFPIDSDVECSGYYTLDQGYLQVVSYGDAFGNCSTPTVRVADDECPAAVTVPVRLRDIADGLGFTGNKSTIVFSCPNIAGNQPGNATAGNHCEDGMALVVNVDCTTGTTTRSGTARGTAPAPASEGEEDVGGTGLAPTSDTFGSSKAGRAPGPAGEEDGGFGTPTPRAKVPAAAPLDG